MSVDLFSRSPTIGFNNTDVECTRVHGFEPRAKVYKVSTETESLMRKPTFAFITLSNSKFQASSLFLRLNIPVCDIPGRNLAILAWLVYLLHAFGEYNWIVERPEYPTFTIDLVN